MEALQNAAGFLGTRASLLTDINLIIQILFYIALCFGIVAQRKNKFHLHDRIQTPVVVLNLIFIALVMIPSARFVVSEIPAGLAKTYFLIPFVHIILGTLAEGLAIYCMLAGFKILPRRIGQLRYFMWATFTFWTAAVIFGIGIYIIWYSGSPPSSSEAALVAEHDAEEIVEVTEDDVETAPDDALVAEHAEEVIDVAAEATPTPAPAATATPIPPTPTPFQSVEAGTLNFSDSGGLGNGIALQLNDVPPPPDGSVYQAWLQGPDVAPLNLGSLTLDGSTVNHTYVDSQGSNLLALYSVIIVTVEEAGGSATAPSNQIAFAGEIPAGVLGPIRTLFATSADTPTGASLFESARGQARLVVDHSGFQQQSIVENNVINLRFHAEHLINIIEGQNGPNFGDNDGNGVTDNPGDGVGLLGDSGYISQIIAQARLASTADGAPEDAELIASRLEIAAGNSIGLLEQIRDVEILLRIEDTVGGLVDDFVLDVNVWAAQLFPGIDANSNGTVEPILGEGTLDMMAAHAQQLATMVIFTSDGLVSAPAAPTEPGNAMMPPAAEPVWQTLQATNSGPSPRYEHAMQYSAATNQIFVFGGRDGSQDFNDTWLLDLNTSTWRELAAAASARPPVRHSTVMIVNSTADALYVAAGQGPSGVLNDVWKLDIANETWTDLTATAGPGPEARYGGPGGNIDDNLVLTHGFGSTRYNDTWRFNTQTEQWENITPAGAAPLNRCLFAASPAGNNLVIHGGCASGFGDCYLEDTWILDESTQAWREILGDVRPEGRQHQTLVSTAEGGPILLYGGQGADNASRDDLWVLDLATESWSPLAIQGPEARHNHSAVWVPNAGMVIFGGRSGSTPLNDLWVLSADPAALQQPGDAPPAPADAPTPTPELISPPDGTEHSEE